MRFTSVSGNYESVNLEGPLFPVNPTHTRTKHSSIIGLGDFEYDHKLLSTFNLVNFKFVQGPPIPDGK